MTRYGNLSGNSGVTEYEIGSDSIRVRFRGGNTYLYDANAPGAAHVAQMKILALAGRGLATYISKNVRENYSPTK